MPKPVNSEKVFSALGIKTGIADEKYFVGRKLEMANLSCCYIGENRGSAWIHGPRRIGKTSLANMIARQASSNDTLVLKADVIDINGDSGTLFDNMLIRLTKKAHKLLPIEGDTIYKNFESLARYSDKRPLLIIIDEVDKVAISMKTDEQAFLRRLVSEYDKFSYCFISQQAPESIVEEVPDINSRLLGVCVQEKIKPLQRLDVKELCKIVGSDLRLNEFHKYHKIIWEMVGGIPIAVNSMVRTLAIQCTHNPASLEGDIEKLLEEKLSDIKIDLMGYWKSLKPGTRLVLMGQAEEEKFESQLRDDGLYKLHGGTIKPKFLIMVNKDSAFEIDIGASSDSEANTITKAENLLQLIAEINEALKIRGFKEGFFVGTTTIKLYFLSRKPCGVNEFKDAIDYLYKVFFEGARERKPNKDRIKEYRLPEPLATKYKKAKVIGDISNLRNFLFHDQTKEEDSEKRNKYYVEASKIYQKYCGEKEPYLNDHRNSIRKGIIDNLMVLQKDILKELRSEEFTPATQN
ncbi:ATP-binding protein [Thermodesulfobacteriota bacterium]